MNIDDLTEQREPTSESFKGMKLTHDQKANIEKFGEAIIDAMANWNARTLNPPDNNLSRPPGYSRQSALAVGGGRMSTEDYIDPAEIRNIDRSMEAMNRFRNEYEASPTIKSNPVNTFSTIVKLKELAYNRIIDADKTWVTLDDNEILEYCSDLRYNDCRDHWTNESGCSFDCDDAIEYVLDALGKHQQENPLDTSHSDKNQPTTYLVLLSKIDQSTYTPEPAHIDYYDYP